MPITLGRRCEVFPQSFTFRSSRLSWFKVALLLPLLTSCSGRAARLKPPRIDPESAAAQAISLYDANGDGTFDDSAWLVLATRASDNVIRVQSRFVADGAFDDNIVILNSNWQAFRMDVASDISGNTAQEMAITATRRSDGARRIHIKDYGSGATTTNIAP